MSAPSVQRFSHYPALPLPAPLRARVPRVPLTVLPAHDCSYLPGRSAVNRALLVGARMSGELYHDFMDAGFRRSGRLLYQPMCPGCRECRPIRVPVERFRASKSQRRCLRRNGDVRIEIARPMPTNEKFDLYRRYMSGWHGSVEPHARAEFATFLYESPVDTIEFTYRQPHSGALLAVGICDVCARSLSSVYFYFDPSESRRGLGTLGALTEIERARAIGVEFYYLGYWVRDCGAMNYKASFRPNQMLDTDGVWRDNLPPPHRRSCFDG